MPIRFIIAAMLAAAGAAHAQPSVAQRAAAARAVAEGSDRCKAVQPFSWSIGDAHGVLADRRVGARAPEADTPMPIASAYAALGTSFRYVQPQLAGGISTSAAAYGEFLRRIVGGALQMKSLLGTHAVCTNPRTCATAVASPIQGVDVHYSIGHWVEDDAAGDGAFSSAGAFGFYPWISHDEATWGVLARTAFSLNGARAGAASLMCGREIRKAWIASP